MPYVNVVVKTFNKKTHAAALEWGVWGALIPRN